MTAEEFQRIDLGFPETEERSHMGQPDFRVGGKIYATIGPDEDWGMAKLTAEQQESFCGPNRRFSSPQAVHGVDAVRRSSGLLSPTSIRFGKL